METRVLPTDSPDNLGAAVSAAVGALRSGEVVALPTETVYGLGADALNPEAVAKIFEAKERPSFDPLIVHVPTKQAASLVAEVPESLRPLIETFWPGPLTLVLPKRPEVPDLVTSGLPTVAVRMSANPTFKKVIKAFGRPVAAPSANRFGRISPTSAGAVVDELQGKIPLIVDGGACSWGLESTIIKVEPGEPKPGITVLRPGPITKDDLKKFGKVTFAESRGEAIEAPGQLESHYAPLTPLRILGEPGTFVPEAGKRYALVSYRGEAKDGYLEEAEFDEVFVLSPGSGKLPEAAVRLFYILRQVDALGVDEILAEPVPERGVGVAIMDRLRRAAR